MTFGEQNMATLLTTIESYCHEPDSVEKIDAMLFATLIASPTEITELCSVALTEPYFGMPPTVHIVVSILAGRYAIQNNSQLAFNAAFFQAEAFSSDHQLAKILQHMGASSLSLDQRGVPLLDT